MIKQFLRDERGQGLSEYGLLLALIALAAIGAVALLGNKIKSTFENIEQQM